MCKPHTHMHNIIIHTLSDENTPGHGPTATPQFTHKYQPPTMHFFPFLLLSSSPSLLVASPVMFSTFPAFSGDIFAGTGNYFTSPDVEFSSWEFPSSPATTQFSPTAETPVMSSSGSDEPKPGSNRKPQQVNSNSNSDEPVRNYPVSDERKRKRMVSNRESARRSRMRKQKHLEILTNQLNRLRVENRELSNRLRFVLYHYQRVITDNDHIRSESTALRQRLSDLRQILLFRQLQQFSPSLAWPCNNFTASSEQIPSLIA